MKEIEHDRIKVGEIASIDITIPVIRIGSGKPGIGIVCGMHGDEKTPLLIASKLKDIKLTKGSLHIFLGVNQLAHKLGKRFVDADLNRSFPGKKDGNLEERIAAKLIKELEKMDLVIDLHDFEMETPLLAIQFKEKDEFVELFNPEQVWLLKPGNEKDFSTALGPLLTQKGIENFAVEMNKIQHFMDTKRVLQGFKSIFRRLGMLDGKHCKGNPKKFARQAVTATRSGIFLPKKTPSEKINKGDAIGEIISLKDLSAEEVRAPKDGVLMQVRRQSVVKTGDDIFAIGGQNG